MVNDYGACGYNRIMKRTHVSFFWRLASNKRLLSGVSLLLAYLVLGEQVCECVGHCALHFLILTLIAVKV